MHQLWFPQIPSNLSLESDVPISRALTAFIDLSNASSNSEDIDLGSQLEQLGLVNNPLNDLTQLLRRLLDDPQQQRVLIKSPVLVLGTLPSQQAARCYSWEEIGLDLFDLPWFEPDKIFRYVSLLSLVQDFENLDACLNPCHHFREETIERAMSQLQWARCHQFAQQVQQVVGHGNRDHLQTMSYDDIQNALARMQQSVARSHCEDQCGLKRRIDELRGKIPNNSNEDRLKYAQEIASLDCRTYRFATTGYLPKAPNQLDEFRQFQRIVILEDTDSFRQSLIEQFQQLGFSRETIITADPKQSWGNFCLWSSKEQKLEECFPPDKNILKNLIEEEHIPPGAILTCFDLDLGSENAPEGMLRFLRQIFGGFWILYGTARQYPQVPRQIITGFRTQDLMSYAAGSAAYLTKPVSPETLRAQIQQAAVLQRVKWICPKVVREDYNNVLRNSTCFNNAVAQLQQWLCQYAIDLEVLSELTPGKSAESDLFVLDLCLINDDLCGSGHHIQNFLQEIATIRQFNHRASLLLVLPMTEGKGSMISECYRKLPISLRGGQDAVIKKPMWIVADGCADPAQGLGNSILRQLQQFHDYDVKYQVTVPVAAIIGRCDSSWVNRVQISLDLPADELYAPLISALVNVYGLSGRLQDIVDRRENLVVDLNVTDLKSKHTVDSDRLEQVLRRFVEDVSDPNIQKHLTLEAWLRASVDKKAGQVSQNGNLRDFPTLIQPLVKVFGGTTRYEFSVRGSWYDEQGQPIDDMLIVIEFCAKSSIASRAFIEKTVVDYLRQIAKEDCVLVQEIALRGYLL